MVSDSREPLRPSAQPSHWCQAIAATVAAVAAAGTVAAPSLCEKQHSPFSELFGKPVHCQERQNFKVTMNIQKDRPGFIKDITAVFQQYELDVRDARISTTQDDTGARHIYKVQHHHEGLSDDQLKLLSKSLQQLGDIGDVKCTAETFPMYTREEVAKHTTRELGVWVTYKDGVYDITNFIANHPGGSDKIMLAAGKSIDPFWRIYQQHEGRGSALKQLESLRIGDLSDPPAPLPADDPYKLDPDRHPGLIFHNNKPCNAELPSELLIDNWCTPNEVWFIRHHHPVPIIDPNTYRLIVDGLGTKSVSITLEDLKSRFLKRHVVSTIQCGGNRRSELNKVESTSGIPWGFGAMSTAKWGGVYLREVLLHCAGLSLESVDVHDIQHVVFKGLDTMQASIPIEKAVGPFADVLLAYEMNGEPLTVEHGFPVRLVAPGCVGVRNVKWVGQITVSKEEAEGPWQRGIAYKGFSPMIKDVQGIDVEKILSIQEMPVQSVIVQPKPGSVTELDDIEVKGFAWSGGGRGIVRVDVSIDSGQTWVTANLGAGSEQNPARAWAWCLWDVEIPILDEMRGKEIEVLCRATDASYNTQPERPEPIWNLRGLNCNCWHRINVQHKDD